MDGLLNDHDYCMSPFDIPIKQEPTDDEDTSTITAASPTNEVFDSLLPPHHEKPVGLANTYPCMLSAVKVEPEEPETMATDASSDHGNHGKKDDTDSDHQDPPEEGGVKSYTYSDNFLDDLIVSDSDESQTSSKINTPQWNDTNNNREDTELRTRIESENPNTSSKVIDLVPASTEVPTVQHTPSTSKNTGKNTHCTFKDSPINEVFDSLLPPHHEKPVGLDNTYPCMLSAVKVEPEEPETMATDASSDHGNHGKKDDTDSDHQDPPEEGGVKSYTYSDNFLDDLIVSDSDESQTSAKINTPQWNDTNNNREDTELRTRIESENPNTSSNEIDLVPASAEVPTVENTPCTSKVDYVKVSTCIIDILNLLCVNLY